MPKKLYLGIDPGKSGGLAVISQGGEKLPALEYVTMPTTEMDIWQWISDSNSFPYIGRTGIKGCYIEKVHSSPQMGVTSAFTFGHGYGGLRMVLVAAGIPFQEVRPREWQKHFGVSPRKKKEAQSAFKNRLRGKCQQLFPSLKLWDDTKGLQLSVCDAILIAEYARQVS